MAGIEAPMRDLEVRFRVRNNRLVQRREELGMGQSEFARAVGICASSYNALETMRDSPRTNCGDWRPTVVTIAEFHGVGPDELFPPVIEAIKQRTAVRRIDAADAPALLAQETRRLAAPVSDAAHRAEDARELSRAVALLPPRQAEVLRLSFGLDGHREHSDAEMAQALGVIKTTVVARRALAIKGLRHKHRGAAAVVVHSHFPEHVEQAKHERERMHREWVARRAEAKQ